MARPAKDPVANLDLLTDKEIEDTRVRAAAKVREKLKKAAQDELLARLEQEELAKLDPAEEMVDVLIDVAGFANRITINGVDYMHGEIRTVPRRLALCMQEIMQNTHRHEKAIGDANRDAYKRPGSYVVIGPNGVIPGINSKQSFLRA